MIPDKPGRELERPRKKIDLVSLYKLRIVNRLSFAEIAKATGMPKSSVHAALHRLNKLIPDPDQVAAFEAVEASVLTSTKEQLLHFLMDPDKLAKASLNNVAYAFSQVANHERLIKGQSTSNVGVLAKLIVQADASLFEKKPSESV